MFFLVLLLLFHQPVNQDFYVGYSDNRKSFLYKNDNWLLSFAEILSRNEAYEESLVVFNSLNINHLTDPAGYFFYRGLAEYSLNHKKDAQKSLVLLERVIDVPVRYQVLSALMQFEMESWQQKDLGNVARKMSNVRRRLQLAKGGQETQKLQKEIVSDLDQMIKQMEDASSKNGNGDAKNKQQQLGKGKPNNPQEDSFGGREKGKGRVDERKLENLAQNWGQLPPKERAKAIQNLTRDMPPKYRQLVEDYFQKLSRSQHDEGK